MPAKKKKVEKIVFFGTPEFAVPSLEALEQAGRRPSLIVSQPSRPVGRGQKSQDPPVAVWARDHGVELEQPESVKDEGFLERLQALAPDIAVVVAFGQIFPPALLTLPRLGCVNVHASLLPKYRGAAPIQAALMEGEKKVGVTIIQLEESLDSGPILLQEETEVKAWETAGDLEERLAVLGGRLLVDTLEKLEKGGIKPRKQREESASYAPRITKSEGKVNWALEAEEIYNRLRAFSPWPGMKTHIRGQTLNLVWAVPMTWEDAPFGATGTFLGVRQGRIAVLCGGGTILGIEELQRPGKKPVRSSDFVNGEHLRVGERFA